MEFTGERYVPNGPDKNDELSVEHLHRYHSVLPLIRGRVVVDIACGEGYGSALMARYAAKVTGIDISEECIIHASAKYTHEFPNLFFEKGDVVKIPLDDKTIDVIVSFETIEHVSAEAQQVFLSEVKRVLKEDGLLIISTPDKENYSDRYDHVNNFHLHELNRGEFKQLLSEYFKVTQILEQGFEIVSVISPSDYSAIDDIRVINWHEKVKPQKRKYLIAIASDKIIPQDQLSSIVLETDKDYFKQIDRIIDLQNEVEKLGRWGQGLDHDRINYEATIKTLNEQLRFFQNEHMRELTLKIEELQKWLSDQARLKQAQIELLITEAEQYKATINHQYQEIQSLSEKHNNLEGQFTAGQLVHARNGRLENQLTNLSKELKEKERMLQDIQFSSSMVKHQLNEVNNKLVTIYESDGWKFLNKYYNLKGKLLNEKSTHYKIIRKVVNFLRQRKSNNALYPGSITKGKSYGEHGLQKEIITGAVPYFEKPEVSIIIPVYNGWEVNAKCVASIIKNTEDIAYEIIIADDCSTDETKNIAEYFSNVVHVRNEKNVGFLLNCNHAATHAKGKYLHFLNNDTEVKPGWLSSLAMLMAKDETIGMAGSKLVYPDGRLQEAGGIIWNDASGWNYGHSQNPELPQFNYVREVDYISGASIMIRTALWNEIGGFDTCYSPAYCEDSDLAFQVRKKGFKVMFQPLSVVTHYEGYSHGSDTQKSEISSIKEYQRINNKKFFEKWKDVLQRDQFPNGQNVFWAKDRSRHKKTLLMVDHYVPQFDKDAGSRTTFQYLELFVKLGFNVKFIGENFYKDEPYTTVLQQMGIEVLYGTWYADNWKQWFIDNKEKFDYIYLNRPHVSINFIDFFKEHSSAKIIYYGHDLHFLRKEKKYALEKDKAILVEAAKWKEIEMYLFSKSDIILTPSTDEQKIIQSLNGDFNVQLMRPYIYKTISMPATNFKQRKDIFFVGGFGHLPNVDGVLWFVKEVWPLVKSEIPEVKFIIAGSNPPLEIKTLASDSDIIIKGYIADDELEKLYATSKIVVIPLRYGAGVKGKTVEAMRYGTPLVTTSFGVEGLPGDFSFLKVSDISNEFAKIIISLYRNEESLFELSKKSVEYVKANFTEKVAEDVLMKAFSTV